MCFSFRKVALVTFAATGPRPVATSAGNSNNDPPPAMELTMPPANAAAHTNTMSATVMLGSPVEAIDAITSCLRRTSRPGGRVESGNGFAEESPGSTGQGGC